MHTISGAIRVRRPVEVVFDYVADTRNEPSYNPSMRSVELLTPEPVGAGSRFKAVMGGLPGMALPMEVTVTEFDRPRRLGSSTWSTHMQTSGTLTFTPDGDDATLMRWEWDVRAARLLRLVGPAVSWLGARMERRIWTAMKERLEADGGSGAGTGPPADHPV